jgi:hypothetical protein
MKRALLVVSAVLALLALGNVAYADSVTVGVANSANCMPLACNVSGSSSGLAMAYQQVFGASSFTGPQPIVITGISFFIASGSPSQTILNGNYTINFWQTSAGVGGLSSTQTNNHGTLLGTFYTGNLGGTYSSGVVTINGLPFYYNANSGNLLMEIIVNNQDNVNNTGTNAYLAADNTGLLTSRAVATNSWQFTSNVGLVTQFTYSPDPDPAPVPEPASLFLFGSGLVGIGVRIRKHLGKRAA